MEATDGQKREMKYCDCKKPKKNGGDNYCQICDGLIANLLELPVGMPSENSFGQWVEAKEFSMPSFGEKVLIITRNGVYDVCRYEKEYINGYTHHSFRNNNNVEKEAFKWMPLPKP